jgi:hypothetical protein
VTIQTQNTIGVLFPAFATELEELIRRTDHPELAAQVRTLPVVARCQCAQDNCAHFYTAPRPNPAYPPQHFCVPLDSTTGFLVLDVLGDCILAVEILDRPEIKSALDAYLPIAP